MKSNAVRTAEEEKDRVWQGYLLALKEARECGVTSVQIPGNADFEAYEKLQKDGQLTCTHRYWKIIDSRYY